MSEERHYKTHVGEAIEDYYEVGKELGKGAFSVVRLVKSKEDGKNYAAKIMDKPPPDDERKCHIVDVEINILKRVYHQNVIKLHEVFETNDKIILVLQLITGGELFDKIVELSHYTEKDASRVVRQLLKGLKALHDKDVAHRDLKPENLLLSDDTMEADVIITDFGLSAILENNTVAYDAVGTPSYIAPEVLATLDDNQGYGKQVDVWGTGVILYILLCGFPPFYGDDEDEIYDRIEVGDYNFPSPYWDPISEEAKALIQRMLELDRNKRITVDEALEHPWVKGDTANDETLNQTVEQLAKFNARRKFKGAVKGLIAANKLSLGLKAVAAANASKATKKRNLNLSQQ